MTVKEAVLKRKGTKVYLEEDQVNLDDVRLVTDAGVWAPTAGNIQTSMVLAITNKDFKKELSAYFDKTNYDQVVTCQALFIFVGTPWKDDAYMKNIIIEHSMQYWGLPNDVVDKMADGNVNYYNNVSEFKNHIDISASSVQLGMMMLQATELGYDTNGMFGFNRTNLTNFLREKGIINERQVVNVAFSMGHRDENHEKNKILTHNRIAKDLLVKEIN